VANIIIKELTACKVKIVVLQLHSTHVTSPVGQMTLMMLASVAQKQEYCGVSIVMIDRPVAGANALLQDAGIAKIEAKRAGGAR
jgi:hypothetical protein